MTRPETLVGQLTRAAIAPLEVERQALGRRQWPPRPITPIVRRLYYEYCAAGKALERLKRRLEAAGGVAYTSTHKPRMKDDGRAREAAYDDLNRRTAKVKELRDVAMLAVLGLDATAARPIVLKLQKDLQAIARGSKGAPRA